MDWQYKTESNNVSCLASNGRQCGVSAGKVLGGSNTIGILAYVRGNRKDFDRLKISGWSYDDMFPYYLKYEGLQDIDKLPKESIKYHNTTGPFKMSFFPDPENDWHQRIIDGYSAINLPTNPDTNAKSQIGVTSTEGYTYKGERESVVDAYLSERKDTLHVTLHSTAIKILIDDNGTAEGVTLQIGVLKKKFNLFTNKDVILSAGYIGTPKLLLLSGIGPSEDLEDLGIETISDLPVGKELSDHALAPLIVKVDHGFGIDLPNPLPLLPYGPSFLRWITAREGPLASNGVYDVVAFLNTECYDFDAHKLNNIDSKCEVPDFQYTHYYLDRNLIADAKPVVRKVYGLDDATFKQVSKANVNNALILMNPTLLDTKSRGSVSLRSTNPDDPPIIKPNYLSAEEDVTKMVTAINILEDILETKPFKDNKASFVYLKWNDCPSPPEGNENRASNEYWACFARHVTFAGLSGTGTASIGRVVDEKLRVYRTKNLRVVDSSVIPLTPSGNSGATVMAVAEKGADIILADN